MSDTTIREEISEVSNERYDDLLDRRCIAKNFLEVVLSQNANVYSINAPWGAGKTWFLKFIEEECCNQNIPFIQFNVWETDYSKEPFQAILSELLSLLHNYIQGIQLTTEEQELIQDLKLVKDKANKLINF